jgi:crossover junction endodeoxyribonuclease RuvC
VSVTSLIVAVDPGFDGAIAFLRNGTELEVHDMPCLELTRNGKAKRALNYHEIGRLFDKSVDADALWIEGVGSMPGQGVSSVFSFGKATGAIIGAAAANFWRIHEVPPVTWKRAIGLKTGDGKDASRALATHLFPKQSALFARKKDDGRAEAALIAWYAYTKGGE